MNLQRRNFIKAAGGATMLLPAMLRAQTAPSQNVLGANNRVRVAVAGVNGRGMAHVRGFDIKDVEVAYLVDPDSQVLAKRVRETIDKSKYSKKVRGVADIRRVLEDKSIDAISTAAPNHWHALMTIWGAQAGKHVYVEKPMSHDIAEGRSAVEAQRRYGVVVQHGTQNRSDGWRAALHRAIKAGRFGRLKVSYGYACKARKGIGHKAPGAPPSELDWDLWRGPADIGEFHGNLVHYNWHWFWQSGNGELNNQGTHQLDIARWAIDDDQTHPIRAMALGGRFQWQDQGETPNTLFAMAEYPNGQQVFFNVRNVNYEGYQHQVENEYYFEDGGKIVGKLYFPKGSTKGEKIELEADPTTIGQHYVNFIAAVRANDPSKAYGNVMEAHYGCVLGHIMNNSYRLGRRVPFSAAGELFGDNREAAAHFGKLHEVMVSGVGLPAGDSYYTLGPVLNFDPATERFVGADAARANALIKDRNRSGYEISV